MTADEVRTSEQAPEAGLEYEMLSADGKCQMPAADGEMLAQKTVGRIMINP
jgi:hypothetical protein